MPAGCPPALRSEREDPGVRGVVVFVECLEDTQRSSGDAGGPQPLVFIDEAVIVLVLRMHGHLGHLVPLVGVSAATMLCGDVAKLAVFTADACAGVDTVVFADLTDEMVSCRASTLRFLPDACLTPACCFVPAAASSTAAPFTVDKSLATEQPFCL